MQWTEQISHDMNPYHTIILLVLCCASCTRVNTGKDLSDERQKELASAALGDNTKSLIPAVPICFMDYHLVLGDD